MIEFEINGNDSGQRVDKFIIKAVPNMPHSLMYRLIREKEIKLNGKRCMPSDRLEKGDILRIYSADGLTERKSEERDFLQSSELGGVIYEDDNIIVVEKTAGVDCHGDGTGDPDTLINRIKNHLFRAGEYDPDSENSFSPALCNRLDRNTRGIVTAAKNAVALREVNLAIKERRVEKYYLAVTAHPLPKDRDILEAWHMRNRETGKAEISDEPVPGAKPVRTGYCVLERKGELCLTLLRLYTGRNHQIRAQLAHIGAPVLGDPKYGDNAANRKYGEKHQLLLAYRLIFHFDEDSPLSYLSGKIFECSQDHIRDRFYMDAGSM